MGLQVKDFPVLFTGMYNQYVSDDMAKERLDKLILDRGLVPSRERARALIMEGKVMVNGDPVSKAGEMVSPDARIELRGEDLKYVGRGGLKLEAAVNQFSIAFQNKIAMDVGSSTGALQI